ncbi:hypothetical protein BJ742DRAFT_28544 [Cladochytrium replicatum]|nr:hypothetical protein BJ742DRAFT_28544 [Cladochytrium replicatum]
MSASALGLDPHGAAVAGAYAAIGSGATLYFGGLVNDTISPSSYSPALSQNPSDEIYEISSALELRKVETSLSTDGGLRPPPTYFQCCVSDPSSNLVVSILSNSTRALNELVLCYGGVEVSSYMWIYHWPLRTWLAPEFLDSDPSGQVEVERYGHSCAIVDGRVSVLGGVAKWSDGSTGPAKTHLLFDLTKPAGSRWKTKSLSSWSYARDVRLGHTLVPITSPSIENAQKPEPILMLFGSNAVNYTSNNTSSDSSQNTVPLVIAFDSTSPSRIGKIDSIGSTIPDIMDGAACTTFNQTSVYCFGGRRRTSAAELSGQIWRLKIDNLNVTADSTYSWSGSSWELIWDTPSTATTPTGTTLFPKPRWGASMTSINNTYLTIRGGGVPGDFLNPKTVAPFADPQLYVFDLRNQSWAWHSSADWRRQLNGSVNNTSVSPSPTAHAGAGALQLWSIAVIAIGGLILVLVAVVAVALRRTSRKHRRNSAHELEQGKVRALVPGDYHLVSDGPPQIPPLIVPDPFQSLTEDEVNDEDAAVLSENRSSTQTQDRRLLRIRESSSNDDDNRLSALFTSIHSSLSSKGPSHRSWDVSSSTPPAGDLGSRSARASGNGMGAAGAVASDLELLVGSDPIAVAAAVAERHRNVVPLLNRLTRSNVDAREFFPGSLEERESLGSVGATGAVYVEGTERRSTARSSGTAEMMATLERIAGTQDLFDEDAESAKLLMVSSAEEGESIVAPASDIPTVPEDEIRPSPSVIFVPQTEEVMEEQSSGEEFREAEADVLLNNNLEDSIDLGSDVAQVGVGNLVVDPPSEKSEDSSRSPVDGLDQAGDRSSKIVEVGQLLIDETPAQLSTPVSPLSVLDVDRRPSIREAFSETTTMRNPSVPMYPIPSQWNPASTPPGSPKRGPMMWPSPSPLQSGGGGTGSRASSAAGSGTSTPLAVQWPPPPPVGVDEPDLMVQVHGQSTDYVVTRAFWPSRPDEIPLEVGDLIAIECRWDDNWARGQNVSKSRRRGVFPLPVLSAIRSGPSHRVAGLSSPPRSRSGSVEGRSASSSGSSSPELSETTWTASASTTPVWPPRGRFLADGERFAVGTETKMMPRSSSLYRASAGSAVVGKEVAEALSRLT